MTLPTLRAALALFLTALAAWLLSAPQAGASDQEARLGITADPESFDPALISGNPDFWIANDLFEGLASYDSDGKLVPGVAQSWEPSPDLKRWTFHLRPDARWSDGTKLTADDFVYALRRAVTPATASPYAAALSPIVNAPEIVAGRAPGERLGVTAPDSHTLAIDLSHPTPFLPALMALPVSFPVPHRLIERERDKWTAAGTLVGNGAFRLVSWTPGSEIVLARNSAFHAAGEVRLDRVRYLVSEDRPAGFKRWLAGEVDETMLSAADVARAKRDHAAEYAPEPLPATQHLIVNMQRAPLGTDTRIRQAISLAIDRAALAGKVDPRGGAPAWSYVPAGLGGYDPALLADRDMPQEARAARARQLIAAVQKDHAGPLVIRLSTYKDDISHRIAQGVAAMLRQTLGVEVRLDEPEWRVWDAQFHHGDFDLALYDWLADYPDPWTFLANFRSDSGPLDAGGYRSAEYDALLSKAQSTADPEDRLHLLRQAEGRLLEDAAVIPLEFDVLPFMISRRLAGWRPNPMDQHPARYLTTGSKVNQPTPENKVNH